jgi:signal transduction histidine kinase/CHASE3 domain sensor protein
MAGFTQNITAKAFVGFLFLALVFGAGTYLIYDRLHDLDPAVQRIREPNKTVKLWSETNKNANIAVDYMRGYLLTGDTALLRHFEIARYAISSQIDSLHLLAAGDEQREKRADTLAILTDRKLEEATLGFNLIGDNLQMGIAIDNAVQQLAVIERKREQLQQTNRVDVQGNVNDTVTHTSIVKEEDSKSNFWQRLLTKRKKKTEDTTMSIEAIASMLDSIIADSVADHSNVVVANSVQDTIHHAMQIANELSRAKTEDFEARETQLRDELLLLAQRRTTDSLIAELGVRMTAAENDATANLIGSASSEVRGTTSNIISILAIGAIVLILLFTIMIRADVRRSALLQEQMDNARKAAEELARTREEFAANMSHEIRGPLNSIMGISEQLSKSPGAGNHRLVEGLVSSSQHLLGLINPVLDVTRLNSGKIEFEIHPFKVRETLEDVHRAFRVSAAEKVLGLEVIVDNKVPTVVLGDDVRLRQVLFNLVGNAIKFTDHGEVTIYCAVKETSSDGKYWLQFRVIDTGIGIEPSAINRIFDEYAQADSTITRKFGGTGLGLSISRKLVEQQNGKIMVKSVEGEGSEFSFEIPFEVPAESQVIPQKTVTSHQHLNGKKILICDDDEMNRMLAAMIITNHGGVVTECGDGEEVIRIIQTQSFDLLVLDINLPGMDGKATVAELRLLGKRLPVIAVTGNAHEEANFRSAGFDAIIIKPYQETDLLTVIGTLSGTPAEKSVKN